LELIEPKAPLFAHGCWGALYKYLNIIRYNTMHITLLYLMIPFVFSYRCKCLSRRESSDVFYDRDWTDSRRLGPGVARRPWRLYRSEGLRRSRGSHPQKLVSSTTSSFQISDRNCLTVFMLLDLHILLNQLINKSFNQENSNWHSRNWNNNSKSRLFQLFIHSLIHSYWTFI